jgi:hypothetical protein
MFPIGSARTNCCLLLDACLAKPAPSRGRNPINRLIHKRYQLRLCDLVGENCGET